MKSLLPTQGYGREFDDVLDVLLDGIQYSQCLSCNTLNAQTLTGCDIESRGSSAMTSKPRMTYFLPTHGS